MTACPCCGSDRLVDDVAYRTSPAGERFEVPMITCLECTEGFEAPGAAEIVKAKWAGYPSKPPKRGGTGL